MNAPLHPTAIAYTLGQLVPGQGGYFAGVIRVDGELFGLIVADKQSGETTGKWLDRYEAIEGAGSYCDGHSNTQAMAKAGSPLATWATALDINGQADWYLPSRDELEMLYRAFKPTDDENHTWRSGDNPSSVPAGYPYTDTSPAQTTATGFEAEGELAFDDTWYWSSTQSSALVAWYQTFGNGFQYDSDKQYTGRARAVRRFKLSHSAL